MTGNMLPRWNLEKHFNYKSPFDPQIDHDLEKEERAAKEFCRDYKEKLNVALADAIITYESLCEKLSIIEAYLFLAWSVNQTDTKLTTRQSNIKATIGRIRADYLTFFCLEVSSLHPDELETQMKASVQLEKYRSWVEDTRAKRNHYLKEEIERALSVRGPWASEEIVVDYYEQKLSGSVYVFDSETLSLEAVLSKLFDPTQEVRIQALKTLNSGLGGQKITDFAALSLNMVAGSWAIERSERRYQGLRSSRNLSNKVPDEVVEALLGAVSHTGVKLAKKYYKLKKTILAKKGMLNKGFTWADRSAPLKCNDEKEEKKYTWGEAVEIVQSGFEKFSVTMRDLFDQMLGEQRIDAPVYPGKRSGAFCHGVSPSIGPFQLNNFMGSKRDVTTLAHESGHGCHDYLAYSQGYLQYHPPLTLAETASIFGEMIVFRDLLNQCKTKQERLSMIMGKIDDLVNSVIRQVSFDRFEELVHTKRAEGIVGDETFSELWSQAMREYYGNEGEVFDSYEDTENLWAYVSHFHNVPFYVYAYAFADLVVGSLYKAFTDSPQGFEKKFIHLLAAGGTGNLVELLKPFNLDPSKGSFWEQALDTSLGTLLHDAETLAKELDLA